MIKRVIFDQDNTLVKWREENWTTLDETFQKLNYKITTNDKSKIIECINNYEKKYSMYIKEDIYLYINKKLNKLLPENWIDIWLEQLSNRYALLEPNTKDILNYLNEKYELVVLTNWFSNSQINILKKLGILHYFNEIIGTDQVLNKPNKEAFLKACGNYKIEECLMIGDNFDIDILGAYSAGMDAIWYNPKHKQPKQKIKVDEIDNLMKLKNYL